VRSSFAAASSSNAVCLALQHIAERRLKRVEHLAFGYWLLVRFANATQCLRVRNRYSASNQVCIRVKHVDCQPYFFDGEIGQSHSEALK
jgi:hypothetical protein